MIITNKSQHTIEGSDFLTIQSKVNEKKLAKLYGLLSNIYRNPIGAIVREYASNAYDANVEARTFATSSYDEVVKKYSWVSEPEFNLGEKEFEELKSNLSRVSETEPVVVGIKMFDNQTYFYVKDYGVGLSPERMMHIYFNYLDSTKEETDDEIGGFGIGSKSALSYANTFYIDTVYNGVLYKYIMTKNAKGIPEGQLLYVSEPDESLENGTTIKVKISESDDIETFIEEISKQLSYMDNLFIDLQDVIDEKTPAWIYSEDKKRYRTINDFIIYRHEKYLQKNKDVPYEELHLSLGKISYTIDWTELGIRALNIPVALQFEIGELQPTPSRESILYTPKSIEVIKAKIKELEEMFIEKFRAQSSETNDFRYYVTKLGQTTSSVRVGDFDYEISDILTNHTSLASNLIDNSNVRYTPFLKAGVTHGAYSIFNAWKVVKKLRGTSARLAEVKWFNLSKNTNFDSQDFIFDAYGDETFGYHQCAFFLEEEYRSTNDIHVIQRAENDHLKFMTEVDRCLVFKSGLTEDEKQKIRDVYVGEIEGFFNAIDIGYKEAYPDPNWHHRYAAGKSVFSPVKKKRRPEGKIFCYEPSYYDNNAFRQSEVDLGKLSHFTGPIIYVDHDNKRNLLPFVGILSTVKALRRWNHTPSGGLDGKKVKLISVSKTNKPILDDMENTMTPEEAYVKLRVFKRYITADLIREKWKDIKGTAGKVAPYYDKVGEYYKELSSYVNTHEGFVSNKALQNMHAVAQTQDLYDKDIIEKYEFVENYIKDLTFFEYFSESAPVLPDIVDLLKLKKKRLSNKFYLKKTG